MGYPEFMQLQLKLFPEEITQKNNLQEKVDHNGWVYVCIKLGIYGLPQAGRLANKLLAKCLDLKGYYYQCQFTPSLWRHK